MTQYHSVSITTNNHLIALNVDIDNQMHKVSNLIRNTKWLLHNVYPKQPFTGFTKF